MNHITYAIFFLLILLVGCMIDVDVLAQSTTDTKNVPVSATIVPAIPECELGTTPETLNFGSLSLPGAGMTATATIDVAGDTPEINYVDNASIPRVLPSPSDWSPGELSLTAYNSSSISVTSTFPSSLPADPAVSPQTSLTYSGNWATSDTQDGIYAAQSGTFTENVSGASVSKYFRFGGVLTVPNTTPEGMFMNNIEVSATCN